MDRTIDPGVRRRQIARRAATSLALVVVIAGAWVWASAWARPSVSRSRIRTAAIDRGLIEASITASGTVVPEFEQILSSPIDARVIRVLKRPGAVLAKGESILQLDVSESVLALERLDQDVAIKRNDQLKTKLELDKTLSDLKTQSDIKRLELQSFKSKSAQNRRLFQQGLLSQEELRQSELNEATASFQLQQLEADRYNAEQTNKARIDGLGLEMGKFQKERAEAQRKLDLATSRSDRKGVLTWVVEQEGSTIQKGAVIAKIADLSSFRIEATISDVHAGRLLVGLPVKVRVNEQELRGTISNILPTIKDGIITVGVSLDDKASDLLRSNLRVEVLVLTDRRDSALRVRKGPFAQGEGVREVFVVRGDRLVKTSVRLGVASFDSYEVIDGLVEGDEVVISDMTDYLYAKEVILK